jgi:hypothetical protein
MNAIFSERYKPIFGHATNVNGIIAYASRAFALFYMLQCLVALIVAWQTKDLPGRSWRMAMFAGLVIVCLAVFALGLPSE